MSPVLGLFLAISANFFWALVNVIDKYLVGRFCKNGCIGSLLVLSSLFPVVLIPIGLILGKNFGAISVSHIAILIISGACITAWMYFYFTALFDSDIDRVVPLFQLTPIFSLVFGYLFLHELPELSKLLWAGIVVSGALILSYERSTSCIKLKLIGNLLAATSIIAFMNVLFKYAALDTGLWESLVFQSIGTVIVGIILVATHTTYRTQFITFIRSNWGIGISLNTLNETLALIGNAIFAYALLIAPIALVQTMSAYQPLFVFILAIFAAKIFPGFISETTSSSSLIQKIFALCLIITGSVFLAL